MVLPGGDELPNYRPTIEIPMTFCSWAPSAWSPDKPVIRSKREIDHLLRVGLRYPEFV